MKSFKKILLVLAVIILLILVSGLLLPSRIKIEREIVINSRGNIPFSLVNELKSWKEWSPWYEMDTLQTIVYSDPSSGTGAYFDWKSENSDVDEGRLTIVESNATEMVRIKLAFKKWDEANVTFRFIQDGVGATKVKIEMPMKAGSNPLKKWIFFFMKGKMEDTYDQALENLKRVSEKTVVSPSGLVDLSLLRDTITPAFHYLSIRDTVMPDSIASALTNNYVNIMIEAGMQGLSQAGPSMAIYYRYTDQGRVMFEAMIPMNKEPKSTATVIAGRMPETTASYYTFTGDDGKRQESHMAIRDFLKSKGRTLSSATWEVYPDPVNGQDQVTQTFYPYRSN